MSTTCPKSRVVYICIILAMVTFAAFSYLLRCDFINYDDEMHISQNPHVRMGFTAANIKWAFTTGYAANWQPITWLSHMLDCELFGLNTRYHHLTSLLLHIINSLLLLTLLYAMTGALWQSAFVAAVFAIHPLHVESVAWVAERKDVLSTFFCLLAIAAYFRYVKIKSANVYLLTLFLYILGLMSKPMLVTFPFLLLLLDYWPLNRCGQLHLFASQRIFYRLVFEKTPFFVLAAVSCVITYHVQLYAGAVTDIKALPIDIRLANSVISYFRYIGKMFWPDGLAMLYPHTPDLPPLWLAGLAGLLLVAISFAVIRFSGRHRYLLTGWFWYLGTLVPVIGMVQVGAQTHADRYTYIPLIGLFIMISWGANDLLIRYPHRKVLLGFAAAIVIAAMSLCTAIQTHYWKNSITLFEHTVAVTGRNCIAHANLGLTYSSQGNFEQAISHYRKALETDPNYTIAITNLGCVYDDLGRSQEAVELHKRAIKIKPNLALAHYNLASAYGKLGRHTEAMEAYEKAVSLNPELAEGYYGLGIAYGNSGLHEKAAQAFKKAVKINPEYVEAYFNLAVSFDKLGLFEQALDAYSQAVQLAPAHAQAHYALGLDYVRLGRSSQAMRQYEILKGLNPNLAQNLLNALSK